MAGLCKAASKVLQPGYKNSYNQDMLRYIPFKSISGKLFNHKGCRAECSVDYQRRGIKRKETATV
jgi:hypothetical protein